MREIITLQLGQQSNYLGTHFWNTQESYFTYGEDGESPVDHDVHFRPGLGADGSETYMPRTVIYDLKGGFGSMRRINALYEAENEGEPTSLWNGQTVVQRQPPINPSAYQAGLDSGTSSSELLTPASVRYWSDFSRVYYHPRSIVQLHEYEVNSSLMPFEKWAMGNELFTSLDRDHDIADRDLRPFVEEADQIQGVQIFCGIDDAWGGFAARYLERLRDEYGKTPVWIWGLQEPVGGISRDKRLLRLVNKARTLADMYTQASLIIPLSIPPRLPASISLDRSSPWHVSALFTAALESTSLYTRLRTTPDHTNAASLGSVADLLNVFGKQTIANLQLSPVLPPRPITNGTDSRVQVPTGRGELYDRFNALEWEEDQSESGMREGVETLDVSLSSLEDPAMSQAGARRGGRKKHLFSQMSMVRGDEAAKSSSRDEGNETDQNGGYGRQRSKTHRYTSPLAFPMLDSYPRIFRDSDGGPVHEPLSMRTVLSTDTSVMDEVKGLRTTVLRSISLEDREDVGNELAEIAEGYREGWDSGSDEGEDE